jgi:hypothetical protein
VAKESREAGISELTTRLEELMDAQTRLNSEITYLQKVVAESRPALDNASQASSSGSLLWVLECIKVEGFDITCCTDDKYAIRHVHSQQGTPMITTQRVGRTRQADFFANLISDKKLFEAVSREHFHISAQYTFGSSYTFWLINCSANGTWVNSEYLRTPGEQIQIHDGDVISLPRLGANAMTTMPFMSFGFSLVGSVLCANVERSSSATGSEQSADRSRSATGSEQSAGIDTSAVEPEFVLEVGGSGTVQKSGWQNVLEHGVYESCYCPDLLLGRAMQPGFWKDVLSKKAYEMLSRRHLKFETSMHSPAGQATTVVENLATDKEVFIYNPSKGMSPQDASRLCSSEKQQLRHGDVIIVNPSHDYVVWLLFIDGKHAKAGATPKPWASPEICLSRAAAACTLGGA